MDTEFFSQFELKLQDELVKICTGENFLAGMLLENDDIDMRWKELAPEYMVDAVEQIRDYPTVSVAWAAYLGMAVACCWDANWEEYKSLPYNAFYGAQGFDDMDEHIMVDILGIDLASDEARRLEAIIRQCGETAVTFIRHERIDPQTPEAFHIFARACRAMFRTGAAIELKRLGYFFEEISLN